MKSEVAHILASNTVLLRTPNPTFDTLSLMLLTYDVATGKELGTTKSVDFSNLYIENWHDLFKHTYKGFILSFGETIELHNLYEIGMKLSTLTRGLTVTFLPTNEYLVTGSLENITRSLMELDGLEGTYIPYIRDVLGTVISNALPDSVITPGLKTQRKTPEESKEKLRMEEFTDISYFITKYRAFPEAFLAYLIRNHTYIALYSNVLDKLSLDTLKKFRFLNITDQSPLISVEDIELILYENTDKEIIQSVQTYLSSIDDIYNLIYNYTKSEVIANGMLPLGKRCDCIISGSLDDFENAIKIAEGKSKLWRLRQLFAGFIDYLKKFNFMKNIDTHEKDECGPYYTFKEPETEEQSK